MKETMNKLYAQFRKPLLYFITSKVRDKNIAEDLLQEVFIKVYKNINEFNENLTFSSWIYRITHNITIDFHRKNRCKKNVSLQTDDDDYKNLIDILDS